MKLLVPYVGELRGVDRRLVGLADFFGVAWESLPLPKGEASVTECFRQASEGSPACLVIHPAVIHECVSQECVKEDLLNLLLSRFPYLLLHAPRQHPFDSNLISALSGGGLRSVQEAGGSKQTYDVASNMQALCGPFAGLSFGTVNPINDRVFLPGPNPALAQPAISVGGLPFMAVSNWENATVLFLAGQDVANLDAEVGETAHADCFSRLLPHSMAIRHAFGIESWHPQEHHASLIVDDPLLRRDYGFLNFETLLKLMEQHRFHTSIAFVPHNFRRNSAIVARSVREHSEHFSLCFHGNDHTGAEFASTDKVLLNTMLRIAEDRMSVHHRLTGIDCGRVMVFPQGKFSTEAMAVLRARNFDAAINTVGHPYGQAVRLTLRELAEPAVHRFANFPLFLRANSVRTQPDSIAFKLFFGIPIFIVEHHDAFRQTDILLAAVSRVNAAAAKVHWTSPAKAVSSSVLLRQSSEGTCVRSYCRTVTLSNPSNSPVVCRIEWNGEADAPLRLFRDETDCPGLQILDRTATATVELDADSSHTFSLAGRNDFGTLSGLGFRRTIRGIVRRRLSEARDNYLSKNPVALAAASAVQRQLFPQRNPHQKADRA